MAITISGTTGITGTGNTSLNIPDIEVDNISTVAGSGSISLSSGVQLVGTDERSIVSRGMVVQMKRLVTNNVTSVSSASYTTHASGQFDYTPKVGNLVIVQGRVTGARTSGGSPSTNWASSCTIWIGNEGMASGNSDFTPVGASSYPGDSNYGREGMIGSYYGQSVTTTGHKTITSSHIAGGNPTFYFKVAELGGNVAYWGAGTATTSSSYGTDLTSMILWEIQQ